MAILAISLFQLRKRHTAAVWCLFAAAFLLRWWMALIDPFLHDWDERFHALVASNMINEPFRPMLLTHPPLGYDYRLWCCNHIWLHKPPLFLWQMAASMCLFGVELWSMRLPSVLMGALLVFPLFRMGTLLRNPTTGFYGATLYTFAYNQLEMISGNEGRDHNDVAFSFYVTLSLWAWFEFTRSQKTIRWAVWIGIFAGAAVLCKWLAGLLVYAVWGIDLLFRSDTKRLRLLQQLLVSFAVALVVFLPWQLYTFWKFPLEAAYEQAYNLRHIFEVVEGHSGEWYYYFGLFGFHYGVAAWPLMAAAFYFVFKSPTDDYRLRKGLLWSIGIVYFFFSFVSTTKTSSFVYFIAPMVYLLFGWVMSHLNERLRVHGLKGKFAFTILLLAACYLTLNPERINKRHFNLTPEEQIARERKISNTRIYRQLDHWTPEGCTVYNCTGELEAMFFSSRVVFATAPGYDEFKRMKQRGACIAIFDDPDDLGVPGFIKDDPKGVIFLKEKLIREK